MMQWKKLKNINISDISIEGMQTHLANPCAYLISDSIARVYCNARDKEGQSHVIYIDLDMKDNFNIVNTSSKPILSPGISGDFDDCGVSLGCLITDEKNDTYMFYLGWNLTLKVPFRNSIGLAKMEHSSDVFKKISPGPIIDRTFIDPYSLSYPYVIKESNQYKMWYGSNISWKNSLETMHYSIKYATSTDLVNWTRNGITCFSTEINSHIFAKPFVYYENQKYHMFYSHRGDTYHIGYAQSHDGIHWERLDHLAGIDVSPSGWDSEMVCYPFILDWSDNRYLFYNGNHYGKTGFGIAILEKTHEKNSF